MKIEKKLFLLFIILVLTFYVSSFVTADNCGGAVRCNCGDWLVESQRMWYDLIDCPIDGLRIEATGITLDCNGHLIDGDISGISEIGIFLLAPETTVTNCNIQEFDFGIYADKGSDNNIITYNAVNDNSHDGIELHKSYNNVIYGNTLINNQGYGIGLSVSSNNDIWNNTFMDNVRSNAYEDWGTNNNNWNLSDVGNYWDDFPSNSGFPYYYEVPGRGDGIDWHPIWPFPNVWITLMPTGSTTFPSSGGVLEYNIEGGNNEPINVILDIWVDVSVPGWTNPYGPVLGPVMNFNMLAYPWQTNRDRELNIPVRAPAGTYSLNAYLGEYDAINPVVYAESHFEFTKEGTDAGSKSNLKLDSSGPDLFDYESSK